MQKPRHKEERGGRPWPILAGRFWLGWLGEGEEQAVAVAVAVALACWSEWRDFWPKKIYCLKKSIMKALSLSLDEKKAKEAELKIYVPKGDLEPLFFARTDRRGSKFQYFLMFHFGPAGK